MPNTENAPPAPDLVEVDLDGGVKVKMSRDDAAKNIAARDQRKQQLREHAEELGKIRAEKDEAAAKVRRAEDDRAAAEAAKKGETDKVREILTREHSEKVTKLADRIAGERLRNVLTATPGFLSTSIADAAALLKGRVRFDIDSDSLVVLNEAGQPLTDTTGSQVKADAFVAAWLKERPHYLRDATPSGSGAEREGRSGAPDGRTITRAQYDAAVKAQDVNVLRLISSGKARVVDPD